MSDNNNGRRPWGDRPGFIDTLTEDMEKTLEKFSERVKDFIPVPDSEEEKNLRTSYLLRYLRGHNFDIDVAFEKIKKNVEWRKEFQPEKITREDVKEIADREIGYITGKDKDGRPVIFVNAFRIVPKEMPVEGLRDWVLFLLESAIKEMEFPVDNFTVIVNVKYFSSANRSKNTAQTIFKILEDNYCERVGKIFIVNKGMMFTTAFSVMKSTMPPLTKKKITVLGSSFMDTLLKHVDKASIPESIGGDFKEPTPKVYTKSEAKRLKKN